MTRIDGPGNVNNNINIELNKVGETPAAKVNSTFGEGFNTPKTSGFGFERTIPGLEDLLEKYNFEPPKYNKNITQLTIADKDYIPDKSFEEEAFCEV